MQETATYRKQQSSAPIGTEQEKQVQLPSFQQPVLRRTRIEYLWPVLLLFVIIGSIGSIHASRRELNEEDRTIIQRQERSLDDVSDVNRDASKRRHPGDTSVQQKSELPSDTGYVDIYMTAPRRDGGQKDSRDLRVPVACYEQNQFPLTGLFVSFMPSLPIVADRLTGQTIIYSWKRVFLLPPLCDAYGKHHSFAELVASDHCMFVGIDDLSTQPFDMESLFQSSSSTSQEGVPNMEVSTGGFGKCIYVDFELHGARSEPKLTMNGVESKDQMKFNRDMPSYLRIRNDRRQGHHKNQSATTSTSTYKIVYPTPVNKASPPKKPRTVHYTMIIDEVFPYAQSSKAVLSVNYSFPGPIIEAYEGDTFCINLCNRLNVPSTLHWHGMRQLGTPDMDGAVGVTQCAIPPRYCHEYKFQANPAGTFWYHGHLLEQYVDGLIGPMIVHPLKNPFEGLYDVEQILMISDWYNKAAHSELLPWMIQGDEIPFVEPLPDAIVVNGQFTQSLLISLCGNETILFRLINAAADQTYVFSVDGCPLHVIGVDSTPVHPYKVDSITLSVGQRTDCIVNLNELSPIYTANGTSPTNAVFIRITATKFLVPNDVENTIPPNEKQRYPYPVFYNPSYIAVLCFDCDNSTPSYEIGQDTPVLSDAVTPNDTNLLDARPYYKYKGGIPEPTCQLTLNAQFLFDSDGVVRPHFNGVTYSSDANYMHMRPDPKGGITSDTYASVLDQMVKKPRGLNISKPLLTNGSDLPTIQSDGNGHYYIPYGCVVDLNVTNLNTGTHPMHLHTFAFWVVASSAYPEAEYKYKGDYLQRDVVNIEPLGWVLIRFVADNPGAWFFHCHIEWHMSAGLAVAFVVGPEQLLKNGYRISQSQHNLCEALRQYNMQINQTTF